MNPGLPFVSARSVIVQQYQTEEAEGNGFLLSSKLSAALEEKYKSDFGDDVIATLEVNYWHFKPVEDNEGTVIGTKITHIVCTKPNGSLPDMAVNKLTSKQAEAALLVSNLLKKQL